MVAGVIAIGALGIVGPVVGSAVALSVGIVAEDEGGGEPAPAPAEEGPGNRRVCSAIVTAPAYGCGGGRTVDCAHAREPRLLRDARRRMGA